MDNKRNGLDSLAFFFLILAVIFAVFSSVMAHDIYRLIPAVVAASCLAYAIFRMLSTNIGKRRYEAEKFSNMFKRDPYKRFKCPECKTLCRVPRNKGKIKITCPNCKKQFIRKT